MHKGNWTCSTIFILFIYLCGCILISTLFLASPALVDVLSRYYTVDPTVEEYLVQSPTLFTPETPKGCCGLKPFTHPSISIVVSR